MNIKYYRSNWEGWDPETSYGYYYSEVIDGMIQRQIIEISNNLYWATLHEEKDERYFFTDQPEVTEEEIGFATRHLGNIELTKEQFEKIWDESKS